ncbi:MAG: IS110 family transposase [Acidimicrobiales bacterium]|jgi:transposase
MAIVEAARTTAVTGGVDTHLDLNVAAALDSIGGLLGVEEFPTTAAGHEKLLCWLAGFGEIARVGVEGTGSYGAGLARYLRGADIQVVEVDRPNRQARRRTGKTDAVDAIEAARAAQGGRALGAPKTRDGNVEAIRALVVARRSARDTRIKTMNQIRHLGFTAPDQLRQRLAGVSRSCLAKKAASLRPRADQGTVVFATTTALRALGRRVVALDEEAKQIDKLLDELVRATAPELLAVYGVGTDTAAALLVAAGDNPDRLRSEPAWAHMCGVAPIEASSGKTKRYRLNRGGNRHANAALWRIVITRMSSDPRTQAYVARRTEEGLTKGEIIRVLKRYVAREVYRYLRPA